jgi:(1->4)-alpha-D-glucan 1-alpha-D-glucosylmutase
MAEVFAHDDYEPLQVSGPYRDHVITFARRRGRHAVIVATARWFASLSDQGRAWPRGDAFDGELHIDGYSLEGVSASDAPRVPLAVLFEHLPVAALKANHVGAAKPAPKRIRQFA